MRWVLLAFAAALGLLRTEGTAAAAECGGGAFGWTQTSVEGLSVMRDVAFAFELSDETIRRLVADRLDKIRQKAAKIGRAVSPEEMAALEGRLVEDTTTRRLRRVCFDALRIDPGRVSLSLVHAVAAIDALPGVRDGVRLATRGGKTGAVSVDYNLNNLLAATTATATATTTTAAAAGRVPAAAPGRTLAVVNAGWSEGIARPAPLGYLRIGGEVVNDAYYPGLSALLCFRPAADGSMGLSYFLSQKEGAFAFETWYRAPETDRQRAYRTAFEGCRDAVQVGPRIVELDSREYYREYAEEIGCLAEVQARYRDMAEKPGICETAALHAPTLRTVIGSDVTGEGAARRGFHYVLTTRNEATLYDLQTLFLTTGFAADLRAFWAVNLAGDSQQFAYYDIPGGLTRREGLDTSLASAIRLRLR